MAPLWISNATGSWKALIITALLNIVAWPLCVLIALVNKITGRKTLF